MFVFFQKVKEFIIDLIFPKQCLLCGLENTYLCRQCFKQIKINSKFYCVFCQQNNEFGQVCQPCQADAKLKAVWVAADYNDKIIQDLVHNLKYKYIEDIADSLGKILIKFIETNNIFTEFELSSDNVIFVPVPLHKKRYLQRGYNQSQLIAEIISKFYNIPVQVILQRIVNTTSQVNLKRKARQENVKNAFQLIVDQPKDLNKKIILIDDVITTGSTLNECARVLVANGYEQIFGLVIAHRQD